ncbi:MAG: DNA repair protein RadC [Flavobacteriales bacterium]|nr:DNA repair protein RadC [Flavobacteriales bacterium]
MRTMTKTMLPREKYMSTDGENMTAVELLTIMIGSGMAGMSASQIAMSLLEEAGGSLLRVSQMTPYELCTVKGIGQAKAVEIAAAFTISRMAQKEEFKSLYIRTPDDIYNALKADIAHLSYEEFWVLYVGADSRLLGRLKVSQGGISGAEVDRRIIFRRAFALGASGVILAHNHPSGSLVVSDEDVRITQSLKNACKLLGFSLVDHVVVAVSGYVSFVQRGIL